MTTDLEFGERLWRQCWPQRQLFDLWVVRRCFQDQYNHEPYFLYARQANSIRGMLALSWIEDKQYFGHFPGELWQGRTWLEQNRLIASNPDIALDLMDAIPAAEDIRYLDATGLPANDPWIMADDTGYLFHPPQYDYSFDTYFHYFSGKRRKALRQELDHLASPGVEYRYNCLSDLDKMFRLNLEYYGEWSYFRDNRFLRAFENLAAWLSAQNLLRVTTVIIGGRIAAVDMGAVWNSTYTLLAGGTDPTFPGVAKLINFHHMAWACNQKLAEIDFLCGDFNWKKRFHLFPRPLFVIRNRHQDIGRIDLVENQRAACAV
ncbi:MAG: GNAT family N-acetyltransferase [Desulfobacteraceae bacterium]|nr:GNAT family N-acetyltransferase [Desulfobacteraceae bacterium]